MSMQKIIPFTSRLIIGKMKLIFSFFLCFTVFSLFAQPRKGDLFIGTSSLGISVSKPTAEATLNSGFKTSFNSFAVSPEFGVMLDNQLLIGAQLGYSVFGQSSTGQEKLRFQNFSAAAFGTYYLNQNKWTPFLATRFEVSSFNNNFFNGSTRSSLDWNAAFGLAFYLTENTALELAYTVILRDEVRGIDEWLPERFRPRIGLTFRQFLFFNRAGIENLNARRFIDKGVALLGGTGNFTRSSDGTQVSVTPSVKHFFADRIYGRLDVFYAGIKAREGNVSGAFDGNNIGGNLSVGMYFPLAKDFVYLLTEPQFGINRQSAGVSIINESSFLRLDGAVLNTAFGVRLGFGIFKGRNKFEPTLTVLRNRAAAAEASALTQKYTTANAALDYEFFLNDRLSLNANIAYHPTQTIVLFSKTPNGEEFAVSKNERRVTDFTLGIRWYLRGSNPE